MSDEVKTEEQKQPEKWSWDSFAIRTFCWKNLIWVISTVLVFIILFKSNGSIDSVVNIILTGAWGLFSIILILHKAFEKAVGNMDIKAELKAGAQLNGELAEIIKNFAGGKNEVK